MRSPAHAALKRELLIRHLDAWTPITVHGRVQATFVDSTGDPSIADAAGRVFHGFADLLARHHLTMLLPAPGPSAPAQSAPAQSAPVELGLPAGVSVGAFPQGLRDALGTPIFAWFDDRAPAALLARVAANPDSELMLSLGSADSDGSDEIEFLHAAGLPLTARVELVDADGEAETVIFATASPRSLERFKDELWALDELTGIRLRDPVDTERTLLDISQRPQLAPLRRALAAQVAQTGGVTVEQLRTWSLRETVYRASDATTAVQSLVFAGAVGRTPLGGRMSADTVIHPVR